MASNIFCLLLFANEQRPSRKSVRQALNASNLPERQPENPFLYIKKTTTLSHFKFTHYMYLNNNKQQTNSMFKTLIRAYEN